MNRNISLDLLKFTMACMIVGLHVGVLSDVSRIISLILSQSIFRVIVPTFLLINGFYFYQTVINQKCSIWFQRVIGLYAFWMLVYSYFWFTPGTTSISKIVYVIFTGHFHLWYVAGMIGAALAVLLFHKINTMTLLIAALLTFIAGLSIQYMGYAHLFHDTILDSVFNKPSSHRNFLLFSFPFFATGFLLNKYEIHKKISFKTALFLSGIGLCILFVEAYCNVTHFGTQQFDNSLATILLCPAIIILMMNTKINGQSKNIALYSSGIYFSHKLFLDLFDWINTQNIMWTISQTPKTVLIILASMMASFFLIQLNKTFKCIL
jgi:hypothetical protein